jgi:hypothetical protein
MLVGGGLQCDALVFDERFDKLCVALEAIRGIRQGDTTTRCTKKKKSEAYDRETIPIETRKKKKKANALAFFVHKKQARALCRISTFTRGNDHVSIVPLRL